MSHHGTYGAICNSISEPTEVTKAGTANVLLLQPAELSEERPISPSKEEKSTTLGQGIMRFIGRGVHNDSQITIYTAPLDIFNPPNDFITTQSPWYFEMFDMDDAKLRLFLKEVELFELASRRTVTWWIEADHCLKYIVEAAGIAPRKDNAASAFKSMYQSGVSGARWQANRTVASNLVSVQHLQAGQIMPNVSFYNWNGNPPRTYGDGNGLTSNVDHPNIVVEVEWRRLLEMALFKVNGTYLNPAFVGPNLTTVEEVWVVLLPEGEVALPAQRVTPGAGPLISGQQCGGVNLTQLQLPVPAAPMLLVVISSRAVPNTPPAEMFEIQWNQRLQLPAWSVRGPMIVDTNDLLDDVYF
jgi:hypothetical protein